MWLSQHPPVHDSFVSWVEPSWVCNLLMPESRPINPNFLLGINIDQHSLGLRTATLYPLQPSRTELPLTLESEH